MNYDAIGQPTIYKNRRKAANQTYKSTCLMPKKKLNKEKTKIQKTKDGNCREKKQQNFVQISHATVDSSARVHTSRSK